MMFYAIYDDYTVMGIPLVNMTSFCVILGIGVVVHVLIKLWARHDGIKRDMYSFLRTSDLDDSLGKEMLDLTEDDKQTVELQSATSAGCMSELSEKETAHLISSV